MRFVQRLAPVLTIMLLAVGPALAEGEGASMPANLHTPATESFFTVWGVFHVGVSLVGTIFLLWLIRRGVEKL